MRRYLGLAFVLGMFACAGSVEPLSSGETSDSPANAKESTAVGAPAAMGTSVGSVTSRPRGSLRVPTVAPMAAGANTESACATSVTLHGNPGSVISVASLSMAFWGGYWSGAGATERAQYETAWKTIGNDPGFYARLAEYSTSAQTIQAGSYAGSTLSNGALGSGALVTEVGIHQEILAEINSGTLPRLVDGRIYIVMLPPGVTSEFDQQNGFVGHHNQFIPEGTTTPIRYVVITYNSDQTYNDPVISHEVSESITDPDLATGWWDQNSDEVGDICRFNYAQLDGFFIEQTFSMKSCGCVGAVSQIAQVADAGTPDTSVTPPATCTAAQWTASGTYPAGSIVQSGGMQYTSAFWNQNDEPSTHNGGVGTGQPWLPPTACGVTKCTPVCGGKQCGSDGCGGTCGTCASGQTCGTDSTCHSPAPPPPPPPPPPPGTCSGVSPWNPSQAWYNYAVGEQHMGSNGHKFTCKNVAYCIDDPTGYVGGTYGWTDNGPC